MPTTTDIQGKINERQPTIARAYLDSAALFGGYYRHGGFDFLRRNEMSAKTPEEQRRIENARERLAVLQHQAHQAEQENDWKRVDELQIMIRQAEDHVTSLLEG